jgi:hypothetical protein
MPAKYKIIILLNKNEKYGRQIYNNKNTLHCTVVLVEYDFLEYNEIIQ